MPLRSSLQRKTPVFFTGLFSGGSEFFPGYTVFFSREKSCKIQGKSGTITEAWKEAGKEVSERK